MSEHISVCICTYQRPVLLAKLLDGLIDQKTGGHFSYSVIIVDNDSLQSARDVVHGYISESDVEIEYHHEPTKGITYARNRSLEYSDGDYIAILDDDEVPARDWLYRLYKALNEYSADAVFGTVLPDFEVDPPQWILNRKYFYWRDVKPETGTVIDKYVTNNALVRRDLVVRHKLKFDHDFAFAGGEDQAFFVELMNHKPDAKFISCKEATVYEFLPSDRCNPDYILKRNLLEGKGRVFGIHKFSNNRLKKTLSLINRFIQSYVRVVAISSLLPFLLLYDKEMGAEYYYKNYYHLGILLAYFDFSPYEDRKAMGLQ